MTSDPRSWGDGSGPWGQDKHHCFVSDVDTLQLMGSYPGHKERKPRPRLVHTGRLLGQGAALPFSPASSRARGGSTTPWPPSHGSGPRVRRALNLACLREDRPGHDPLLLPLPARASPLRPTATIAQTCSRALSCYFVLSRLIFQGPTSSGSILTKAAVWPGVGGASAVSQAPPSGSLCSGSQVSLEFFPDRCRMSPLTKIRSCSGVRPSERTQGVGSGVELTRVLDPTAWKNALEESNREPAWVPHVWLQAAEEP